MMNYEMFKEQVSMQLETFLPDAHRDRKIDLATINGLNGPRDVMCFLVGSKDEPISPKVYLDELYDEYKEVQDLNAILYCTARELFKSSVLSNAAGIVLCHNHPSSDLRPSESDLHLTARLKMAGEIIGIDVLDHIIVGGDNTKYFSFAENNIMPTISYLREAEQHEKKVGNITQMPMAAERGNSR